MFTNQEYKEFDFSVLIDMLAEQTIKYTRALVKGESGQTLDYYRTNINLLSTEIKLRKADNHISRSFAAITHQQQASQGK